MNSKDVALLVGAALSLIELIIRLRSQTSEAFESEEETLQALALKTNELLGKPADYLQNWRPEKDINPLG